MTSFHQMPNTVATADRIRSAGNGGKGLFGLSIGLACE
jgi:hypothetical protein